MVACIIELFYFRLQVLIKLLWVVIPIRVEFTKHWQGYLDVSHIDLKLGDSLCFGFQNLYILCRISFFFV